MLKPSMRLLVAENDDGEVVGYAMWERLGNDAIAQKVKAERDGILLRKLPPPPLLPLLRHPFNEVTNS